MTCNTQNNFSKSENLVFLTDLVESPVTSLDVKNESAIDPIITRVIHYVLLGWPTEKALSPAFDPYKNHKEELSIYQGFLIWDNRVLIPETLQLNLLESLHEAHPGISRMKSLASSYFWWVNMDEDIIQGYE